MNRELTDRQKERLSSLEWQEPLSRVISWGYKRPHSGPVIRKVDGTIYLVTQKGRLVKYEFPTGNAA